MPDLTQARAVMGSVFADDGTRCVIVRDPQGVTDDLFDETTLTSSRPTADTNAVYTGPCLCRPTQGSARREEGGTVQSIETWRLRIPATETTVKLGDEVSFTDAPNDPQLLTRTFVVDQVLGGSLSVSRILLIVERTRAARL